MRFFFYGTLCDLDVLRLVLGYRPARHQIRPATLPGFRRKGALERSYPVLLPAPGGRVRGVLFQARGPQDGRRLAVYEGPEYITRLRLVWPDSAPGVPRAPQPARIFLPTTGLLRAALADWYLPAWRRHHKAAFLQQLRQPTESGIPCANPSPIP